MTSKRICLCEQHVSNYPWDERVEDHDTAKGLLLSGTPQSGLFSP